jgi:hypothetical protein
MRETDDQFTCELLFRRWMRSCGEDAIQTNGSVHIKTESIYAGLLLDQRTF